MVREASCALRSELASMSNSKSSEVEHTLASRAVHDEWESAYGTDENEAFFERAFDYIAAAVQADPDAICLDVGCGIGAHSIRLAQRGFRVEAVDVSESVLRLAQANVERQALDTRITIRRESLLDLSFQDSSF